MTPTLSSPVSQDPSRAPYKWVDARRVEIAWPQVLYLTLVVLATLLPFALALVVAA